MTIEVTRALGCSIEVDGGSIQLLTTASMWRKHWKKPRSPLETWDRLIQSFIRRSRGLTIKIVRVKEEIKTEKQEIDFNTRGRTTQV